MILRWLFCSACAVIAHAEAQGVGQGQYPAPLAAPAPVVMGQGDRAKPAATSDLILRAQAQEALRKADVAARIQKAEGLEDERRSSEAQRESQSKIGEAERKSLVAVDQARAGQLLTASSVSKAGPAMAARSGMGEAEAALAIAGSFALLCALGALAAKALLSRKRPGDL